MIRTFGSESNTGPIRQPQASTWNLSLRHLQPFLPSDPFHALVVHFPALAENTRSDNGLYLEVKRAEQTCQAQLDMSSSSQSRHVRFYVPAAAAWLVRSGRRRLRHGWSGLGVTGHRGW